MKVFFSALSALAFAGIGCTHTGALKAEAAKDFECPEDQIEIKNAASYDREVTGCGKRARYHWNGSVWNRDGQPTVDGAQPSAAPKVGGGQ